MRNRDPMKAKKSTSIPRIDVRTKPRPRPNLCRFDEPPAIEPEFDQGATRIVTAPKSARRPHAGFDRERQHYETLKPALLRDHPEKFVVLVGCEMIGPFAAFGDAYRAGLARFGDGPLYIKQVLAQEPHTESGTTRDACRS